MGKKSNRFREKKRLRNMSNPPNLAGSPFSLNGFNFTLQQTPNYRGYIVCDELAHNALLIGKELPKNLGITVDRVEMAEFLYAMLFTGLNEPGGLVKRLEVRHVYTNQFVYVGKGFAVPTEDLEFYGNVRPHAFEIATSRIENPAKERIIRYLAEKARPHLR